MLLNLLKVIKSSMIPNKLRLSLHLAQVSQRKHGETASVELHDSFLVINTDQLASSFPLFSKYYFELQSKKEKRLKMQLEFVNYKIS